MKVQLLKSVPAIGRPPDVVEVADAYARNFLLPRGLARVATVAVVAQLARSERQQAKNRAVVNKDINRARECLRGQAVTIRVTANPQGKLFAALRQNEVIRQLQQQYRVNLTGLRIEPDHWKTTGRHELTLHWPDRDTSQFELIISHD